MARALRILVAGGWYHVTARGNHRAEIYGDDTDRQKFLSLVGELPERFSLEVHAFVLMDNHYHLVVRTPEPNLSHAIRWVHVSYSRWFNGRHRQVGHLFQGRFHAVVLQGSREAVEVARYVHLNPVRVQKLGLGKAEVKRQRSREATDPGAGRVAQRLAVLRQYRWSSWPVYAGKMAAPAWLETGVIASGCGGRARQDQRTALRAYTEEPLRSGHLASPWARLVAGLVLGEETFARQLLRGQKVDLGEQTAARRLLRGRLDWARIVAATEAERGQPWPELLRTHGDWGRDGALYVAVRHGGHRLAEVVGRIPGLSYGAAAQAVRRFGNSLAKDPARQRYVQRVLRQLAKV